MLLTRIFMFCVGLSGAFDAQWSCNCFVEFPRFLKESIEQVNKTHIIFRRRLERARFLDAIFFIFHSIFLWTFFFLISFFIYLLHFALFFLHTRISCNVPHSQIIWRKHLIGPQGALQQPFSNWIGLHHLICNDAPVPRPLFHYRLFCRPVLFSATNLSSTRSHCF